VKQRARLMSDVWHARDFVPAQRDPDGRNSAT
jgi:hypothetical protein